MKWLIYGVTSKNVQDSKMSELRPMLCDIFRHVVPCNDGKYAYNIGSISLILDSWTFLCLIARMYRMRHRADRAVVKLTITLHFETIEIQITNKIKAKYSIIYWLCI